MSTLADRRHALSLHDWQMEDFEKLRVALKQSASVLYQLPTGGGKTLIAGFIAQRLRKNGLRILIIVHRRELIDQFIGTMALAGLGEQVGVIANGYPETPWAPIQIASVFTKRAIAFNPHLIIVDEAHHARAKSWADMLERFPRARRLGLTATPKRLDGRGLGEHFEVMVRGPQIGWLVENDFLSPIRVKEAPSHIDPGALRSRAGEFTRQSVAAATQSPLIVMDFMKAWQEHCQGRRCLYFAPTIKQSEETVEKLKAAGARAVHVDGSTDLRVRKKIFDSARAGEIDVICNVDIASEGTDVPGIDAVIDQSPTMSVTRYLQRLGRGTRRAEGKVDGLYVSLAFNEREHGPWDAERLWTLEDEDGLGEPMDKAASTTRCCPACSTVYRRTFRECPDCGETPPSREVLEIDEGLVEGTGNTKPKRANTAEMQRMIQRAVRSDRPIEALADVARARGFANPTQWARTMAPFVGVSV